MKKIVLILYGVSVYSVGIAQCLSPSVVAVSGGTARTQTMTLDWTLGESVVGAVTTSTRLFTQGFHQPILQVSEQMSVVDTDAGYKFTVAPNPVVSYLNIAITAPENSPMQLMLTDLRGYQYSFLLLPASTRSTQIDMTAYPAGAYLLRIGKADGPLLKSYKIVKIQ